MKPSRLAVTLLLFSLAVPACFAQQDRLLVTQKGYRSLAIVDPAAGTVIASVQEGGITGHEVTASPDGRLAYVPIYGNSGVGKPGTDGRNMVVIDIAAQKVVASVDFGHGVRPHMPILGPRDGLLYVTTELDNAVTIVDPKTLKIVGSIPTGQAQSHMLALSHDGRRGYTSNVEPGSVSVLDMQARKTLAIIPISPSAQRISISNDDRWVFTADQTKPRLAVIDTTANQLSSWIPLDAAGYGSAPTPDGRWLLIALPDLNKVAVIDLQTMQVARSVAVGSAPQEVLVRPDGKVAYVSCIGSDQVAEIDLASWKVTRLIATGKGTDGLAWAAAH
ncbi:MAG: cytochrome D1 domain-containing protein [Terracidiphilus sp.]|jgi:YVTN family beta-propeller protein